MEEHQRQLHGDVRCAIARLEDPLFWHERCKLTIPHQMDQQSTQRIVDFLDTGTHSVTELVLNSSFFGRIPTHLFDSGWNVWRTFFARSDISLTQVTVDGCSFGSQEDATRLIGAFQTNRTVTDLTLRRIHSLNGSYMKGAALGNSLSSLMQNMPQLQKLACALGADGVRAFQPGLQLNRTLRELKLVSCSIRDDGVRLLADAMAGNEVIEIVDISANEITSNGLDDITRLIQSTRMQNVNMASNGVFANNATSTRRFALVLSRHEFLKGLNLRACGLEDDGILILVDALVQNAIMEVLDISFNHITYVGLANITRLLVSTQLKTIDIGHTLGAFDDEVTTQLFVTTLECEESSLQELWGVGPNEFPGDQVSNTATFVRINNSLMRNQQLNLVNLLLAPPPPQQQRNAGTMMIKIAHKAITKFAMVPNNAGTSAIFKLFTARPQILEKRLKRPTTSETAAAGATADSQEQKRRRL